MASLGGVANLVTVGRRADILGRDFPRVNVVVHDTAFRNGETIRLLDLVRDIVVHRRDPDVTHIVQ